MGHDTEDFFSGKRPWSKIKDRVLSQYMTPYIAKIARSTDQDILLIDAFAGPGRFDDGTPGSPLIICKAAQANAKGRYLALFANKRRDYHDSLDGILRTGGWYPSARAIYGDGPNLLRVIGEILTSQPVFLYVDPFGLDCEFSVLEPFLQRNSRYSTEILINLNAGFHRLASREALNKGPVDPDQIRRNHGILTSVFGGDYWKDALLAEGLDAKTRERTLIDAYRARLASTGYLRFTGACPVMASRDGLTKYYMVFASRHPDSKVLFNDAMCKAFNEFLNEEETRNTLFEGISWTEWHDTRELVRLVKEYVGKNPGKTRKALWPLILEDHFMRFTESEYLRAVQEAVDAGSVQCPTPRKTRRLNDTCVLLPNVS